LTEQAFVQQLLDAAGSSIERGSLKGTNVLCSAKHELDLGGEPAPVREAASGHISPAAELLSGLFGPTRRLYKRLVEFSHFQERQWYERIARQPYPWLIEASEAFAAAASRKIGR